MTQGQTLAAELAAMLKPTRTVLERIPHDRLVWKPHEKSMTIGRLGMHIAELPHWIIRSFASDHFDFGTAPYNPNIPERHEEILTLMDSTWTKAIALLEQASDADLTEKFTLKRGDTVLWSLPRSGVGRGNIGHIIHHRGQLTVFLRLLDVPVPELYGPTADTRR